MVDAQVRVSAAELNIGDAHLRRSQSIPRLAAGVLRTSFSNLGVYGGQASGQLIIDVSSGIPGYALTSDSRRRPRLAVAAQRGDFDKLDGRCRRKWRCAPRHSQRAVMSNLGGTVFAVIPGRRHQTSNVAQMIRSLTSGTLSGWQEGKEQTTTSPSFRPRSASRRVRPAPRSHLVGPLVR